MLGGSRFRAARSPSARVDTRWSFTPHPTKKNVDLDASWPDEVALDALYRGEAVASGGDLYLPLASAFGARWICGAAGLAGDFENGEAQRLRSFRPRVCAGDGRRAPLAEVERLAERSTSDLLTGVLNRRGFDERSRLEWRRAVRERSSISVALSTSTISADITTRAGATARRLPEAHCTRDPPSRS